MRRRKSLEKRIWIRWKRRRDGVFFLIQELEATESGVDLQWKKGVLAYNRKLLVELDASKPKEPEPLKR